VRDVPSCDSRARPAQVFKLGSRPAVSVSPVDSQSSDPAGNRVKTVPYVPLSHPFIERLVGTIRREYLDQILFWTTVDLEEKLADFQSFYNGHRTHTGLGGGLPEPGADGSTAPIGFESYRWRRHCRGLFQTPTAA
jgi:hypothetical protein